MSSDYRRALDTAIREYETALADRAALEQRIAQLHQTIGMLSKLCGLTPTVEWGLTDACRAMLRSAGQPLSAVQVRDRLQASGFDLDRYANALAAVHTVLKRLAEQGQAAVAETDDSSRLAYEFLRSGVVASRVGPLQRMRPAAKGRTR